MCGVLWYGVCVCSACGMFVCVVCGVVYGVCVGMCVYVWVCVYVVCAWAGKDKIPDMKTGEASGCCDRPSAGGSLLCCRVEGGRQGCPGSASKGEDSLELRKPLVGRSRWNVGVTPCFLETPDSPGVGFLESFSWLFSLHTPPLLLSPSPHSCSGAGWVLISVPCTWLLQLRALPEQVFPKVPEKVLTKCVLMMNSQINVWSLLLVFGIFFFKKEHTFEFFSLLYNMPQGEVSKVIAN